MAAPMKRCLRMIGMKIFCIICYIHCHHIVTTRACIWDYHKINLLNVTFDCHFCHDLFRKNRGQFQKGPYQKGPIPKRPIPERPNSEKGLHQKGPYKKVIILHVYNKLSYSLVASTGLSPVTDQVLKTWFLPFLLSKWWAT